FGKVYRARLEGPAGFVKDVAIKLLTDRNPTPEVLQRFRDESRILGLVRDRAVITVEPPLKLGGYWAIVMEYVPGASCRALVRHRGPFPPKVALDVIQEVARALDHLFHQRGPHDRPLQLIHRDIKPGNIQLTRSGEVKLLDFGVARAKFAAREAHTTHAIQGTYGYIAPERLQGIETPAADVFSLGMVLYKLITGGPTDRQVMEEARDRTRGAERAALDLAVRMSNTDPLERPTLREVESLAADLARRMEGPTLRQWAENHVPHRIGSTDDPLSGQVLTTSEMPEAPPPPASRRTRNTALLATLTAVNLLLLLCAVAVVGMLASAAWVEASDDPGALPWSGILRRPVTVWTLESEPPGAEVRLDGNYVGVTPLEIDLTVGDYEVEMSLEGRSAKRIIEVERGRPATLSWDHLSDGWNEH
ncbi:MAG: serine/threonine-protein kinase, partial [Myxococcota bacterium]